MSFRNFYVLALIIFTSNALTNSSFNLGYSYNKLNPDWKFLPNLPNAFKSNETKTYKVGIGYKGFILNISKDEFSLNAQRNTEPKKINLSANNNTYEFIIPITEKLNIKLLNSEQKADRQFFECYSFGNLVIGGCIDSDISIISTDEKYDDLGDNLISIDGEAKTDKVQLEYDLNDNIFLDQFGLGISNTISIFDWKTPIEEIDSPVILGLSVGGITLGEAIQNEFQRLPQRNDWETKSLDLIFSKSLNLLKRQYLDLNIFYDLEYKHFSFSNYTEYNYTPKNNVKFRLGSTLMIKNLEIKIYADYYHNNLIGFQPISFNQRTEHYFDDPFGEAGISINYKFLN